MFIPVRTDYRMKRRPWVNYALVVANVAIFLMGYNGGNERIDPYLLNPDAPQLVQFFTSVFLHATGQHIFFNMVFLWVFGNVLNDRLGHVAYLAFYLGGGLLAGVGYILFSGHAPVLGASGAISAVTGAYLVLVPGARLYCTSCSGRICAWVGRPLASSKFLTMKSQNIRPCRR